VVVTSAGSIERALGEVNCPQAGMLFYTEAGAKSALGF